MTSSVSLLSAGDDTLPVSTPGAESTVTVTDASCSTTCSIILTKTSNVSDGEGPIGLYVYSQDTNGFVVRSDKRQLTTAMTFDYMLVEPAVA